MKCRRNDGSPPAERGCKDKFLNINVSTNIEKGNK